MSVDLSALRDVLDQINRAELEEGDIWYVVSEPWLAKLRSLVKGQDGETDLNPPLTEYQPEGYNQFDSNYQPVQPSEDNRPGKIDNSILMEDADGISLLREKILEGIDYTLVPGECWEKLVEWYGDSDTIAIERRVLKDGSTRDLFVDVHYLRLQFVGFDSQVQPLEKGENLMVFSKMQSVEYARRKVANEFRKRFESIRMYNLYSHDNGEGDVSPEDQLDDTNTLYEEKIMSGQRIGVEFRNVDGTWPMTEYYGSPLKKKLKNFLRVSSSTTSSAGSKDGERRVNNGRTGLRNLGNTCFMNSGIQCLSNTVPLTQYFTSGDYLKDINKTNPIGMKGKLAVEYGELMKQMWLGGSSSVSPINLKHVLGSYSRRFSGYKQQDAQELISALLDGLHEDVNLRTRKPYIENKDSDGRPDEEVAEDFWNNHLARNLSIVVDLFQGQYKSTVICPECSYVSIVFDPFMYLSVPIPRGRTNDLTSFSFYFDSCLDGDAAVKHKMLLPSGSKYSVVVGELSSRIGDNGENILIAGAKDNRIRIIHEKDSVISNSGSYTTMCFLRTKIGTPEPKADPDPDSAKSCYRIHFFHRLLGRKKSIFRSSGDFFGNPFVLFIHHGTKVKDIYDLVLKHISGWMEGSGPIKRFREEQMDVDGSERSFIISDEESEAGNQSQSWRWPFTLRYVSNSGGKKCLACKQKGLPESEMPCSNLGCPLTEEHLETFRGKKNVQTLCIDWDQTLFDEGEEKEVFSVLRNDDSVHDRVKKPQKLTLASCFDVFVAKEILSPANPWFCPKCKKHLQATKQIGLWKPPRILIIHLKRFRASSFSMSKNSEKVFFPVKGLNIKKWVSDERVDEENCTYDLFAVVNHYGSMAFGHYTACAKNTGEWMRYDDSSVSKIGDENSVVASDVYVLFYRRRNISFD